MTRAHKSLADGVACLASLLAALTVEGSPRLRSFHIDGDLNTAFETVLPVTPKFVSLRVLRLRGSTFEVKEGGPKYWEPIAGLRTLQVCTPLPPGSLVVLVWSICLVELDSDSNLTSDSLHALAGRVCERFHQ